MPAPNKITGKAGTITYNTVVLSITKWESDIDKDMADSTDSSNYDATTQLIHKAQLAVSIQNSVSVEGYFDLNTTDADFIAQLYSANAPVAVILGLTASVVFGHGNFDLTKFKVTTPITKDMVSFTCTLLSNGIFTHGS